AAQRNGGGNQNGGDRAVDEKGEKAHLRLLFMARKATFHVQRQCLLRKQHTNEIFHFIFAFIRRKIPCKRSRNGDIPGKNKKYGP
ncbi:hypothetical protein MJM25_28425, partial [Salmonella enterica subsp. enterica serovar Lubbock]|nr:hypothetical protein [Salmonella enterica subsp. enterica serovar Lubbock]